MEEQNQLNCARNRIDIDDVLLLCSIIVEGISIGLSMFRATIDNIAFIGVKVANQSRTIQPATINA